MTSLANSTVYGPSSFSFNVGYHFYTNGYTSLFNSAGKYISTDGFMNLGLSFEMQFTCKNSSVKRMMSKIVVKNDSAVEIDTTQYQGIEYRTAQTFNENIYYAVGPFKYIIDYGQYIYVVTDYEFTTGTEGTLTRMNGKFSMDRNVL